MKFCCYYNTSKVQEHSMSKTLTNAYTAVAYFCIFNEVKNDYILSWKFN